MTVTVTRTRNSGILEATRMNLVTIPCPICSNSAHTPAGSGVCHKLPVPKFYAYVRCSGCGVTYLNPRPTDADLSACYEQLDDRSAPPVAPPTSAAGGLVGRFKAYWRAAAGHRAALAFVGAGPVLDVGSGYGELLDALAARGTACVGLEFSPNLVAQCRARGHEVLEGDVRSAELPAGRYGTIVLSHVLEHLDDPVGALRKLRRALAPGGTIVVLVPHVGSPMRRLFGRYWHGWDPPFHLVHYTVSTLRMVAARAGLLVVRHKLAMSPEDLTRSLNLRSGVGRRRLLTRAVVLPAFKALGLAGFGSTLTAVLAAEPG